MIITSSALYCRVHEETRVQAKTNEVLMCPNKKLTCWMSDQVIPQRERKHHTGAQALSTWKMGGWHQRSSHCPGDNWPSSNLGFGWWLNSAAYPISLWMEAHQAPAQASLQMFHLASFLPSNAFFLDSIEFAPRKQMEKLSISFSFG